MFEIEPKPGRAVMWLNNGADGQPDHNSEHQGLPGPEQGEEKLIMTFGVHAMNPPAGWYASPWTAAKTSCNDMKLMDDNCK